MTPETLKAIRKELGYSLTEMAILFGVTRSGYAKWEQGPPKGHPVPQHTANLATWMALKGRKWLDRHYTFSLPNESSSSCRRGPQG